MLFTSMGCIIKQSQPQRVKEVNLNGLTESTPLKMKISISICCNYLIFVATLQKSFDFPLVGNIANIKACDESMYPEGRGYSMDVIFPTSERKLSIMSRFVTQ